MIKITKKQIIIILVIILIYLILKNILINVLRKVENLEGGENKVTSTGVLPAFINTLVSSNSKLNNIFSSITDTDVVINKNVQIKGGLSVDTLSIQKDNREIFDKGIIKFSNCDVNNIHSHEIKFNKQFKSQPIVMITPIGKYDSIWSPSAVDITNTGFKLSHKPGYKDNNSYSWIAISGNIEIKIPVEEVEKNTTTDELDDKFIPPPPIKMY